MVFSFFSTILLKADTAGELLTHDRVGVLMVVVNVPMALFFVWDVRLDVVEHFAVVEEYMISHSVVRTEQGDGGSRNDVRRGASPARSSTPPRLQAAVRKVPSANRLTRKDHDEPQFTELWDEDTGRAYFVNKKTGASSWERPAGLRSP